jgi:hypothetical protein
MSERIRSSFQFLLTKLGCSRRPQRQEKRSLQRERLHNFDNTLSLDADSDEIQECNSDCTSCENARLLDELHGVNQGDEIQLDIVIDKMLDKSLLTPSKLPEIESKRAKPQVESSQSDLEEVMIRIDRDLVLSKEEW